VTHVTPDDVCKSLQFRAFRYNGIYMTSLSPQARSVSVLSKIFERLEAKSCPQGLNVMAEEFHWLGDTELTHERLTQAVKAEMGKPRPRLRVVVEGVYWFADRNIPIGWSIFGDRRMLPCFYREYPPHVSWDDLDRPENILPAPGKLARAKSA
jgi:hypothetical protein